MPGRSRELFYTFVVFAIFLQIHPKIVVLRKKEEDFAHIGDPKMVGSKIAKVAATGPLRWSRNSGVTLSKCRESRGKWSTLFEFLRFLWMFHFLE